MKRTKKLSLTLFLVSSLIGAISGHAFAQPHQTLEGPDDRYGSSGRHISEYDESGRIVSEKWTDSKGNVLEEVTVRYEGNDRWEVTEYHNPPSRPNGPRTRTRRKTRRVRKNTISLSPFQQVEEETLFRDEWFAPDGTLLRGTRSELEPNGIHRTYHWDREKHEFVEDALAPPPPPTRPKNTTPISNEVGGGLAMVTFSTPIGQIKVNLPDDMAAGDTLSGTVSVVPEGRDEREKTKTRAELEGYVVDLENQRMTIGQKIMKFTLPTTLGTAASIILRDKKGKEVARSSVRVETQTAGMTDFELPLIGQQGRTIEIRGPFDGTIGTSGITVGSEEMPLVAESPRKLIGWNTAAAGASNLSVREQGRVATGVFRTINLKMSAAKLNLLRGEQTTLVATITGLEDLKSPIQFVLDNRSPLVVQMAGGNLHRFSIEPGHVSSGQYVTNRSLTGVQPGSFMIIGNVVSTSHRLRVNVVAP